MWTAREVRTVFRDAPGGDLSSLMDLSAYLTVAVGYLYAVLQTAHLALVPFVLFTLVNVAWVGAFWYMSRGPCPPNMLGGPLLAMGAFSVGAEFISWLGFGFDWLLPVVSAAIICLSLSWRAALVSTLALFMATSVAVAGSTCSCAAAHAPSDLFNNVVPSILSIAPAYVFAVIFALVMQRQQMLRERAEALAAEVSRAKGELEEANIQLREFSAQVEELTIAKERNRVAREIHDTLGHYLTILAVQLETATMLEERGDPRLRQELVEARRVASECLVAVRSSVAALRPAGLTAGSLADALRRLVGEFESAAPAVEATLDVEGPLQDLTPEQCVTLFRCAQEALTNVRKHAQASKVLLRLRVEPATVELTALDNGSGATHTTGGGGHAPGFGLIGMRERVALLGGTVTAGTEPEHGWRIEVHVPREAAQVGVLGQQ
jgi:signal transduction histidine kinase